jgi:peptidoglycan/LPS O-acetylase OafA/YrhL
MTICYPTPNSWYPASLQWLFLDNSFFRRFDSLAFGCLCAVLYARKREGIEAAVRKWRGGIVLVATILVVEPHVLTRIASQKNSLAVIEFGDSLQDMGFSIFLLHSLVEPDWSLYRALNWTWVRRIGVLSYSLYIWQQLFWAGPKLSGLDRIWWMGLWLLPLFAVASISYYGLERPLLTLRERYRKMKLAT